MLTISHLCVNYGPIRALSDVNLEVGQGEIVALIGANGAGKTTLLKTISSIVHPSDGQIHFKGRDITHSPAHEIASMGLAHVPQGRQIFGDQSVEDNLLLGAYTHARKDRKHVAQLMEREYSRFPILKQRSKQVAGTLSGGEQQMLAPSRGLMLEPSFLALDEPSLGLAPLVVQEITRTIKELNQSGVTILLVEQLATMALSICHRAYVLQTGRVTLEGTGTELLRHPEVIRAYLGGS